MPSWGPCRLYSCRFTACHVPTNQSPVAIKQMDLDKQPRKDLLINEILVLQTLPHVNIVEYINSFVYMNEFWVVTEYMEGGSLMDTVTKTLITEGQIAAVSRETALCVRRIRVLRTEAKVS